MCGMKCWSGKALSPTDRWQARGHTAPCQGEFALPTTSSVVMPRFRRGTQ